MRMRGLEPPQNYLHTDLNSANRCQPVRAPGFRASEVTSGMPDSLILMPRLMPRLSPPAAARRARPFVPAGAMMMLVALQIINREAPDGSSAPRPNWGLSHGAHERPLSSRAAYRPGPR